MSRDNPLNLPHPDMMTDWLYGLISTAAVSHEMFKHNFTILEGAVMAFGIANTHTNDPEKFNFNDLHRRGLDLLAAYVPAPLMEAWKAMDRKTMEASEFCSQGAEAIGKARHASR